MNLKMFSLRSVRTSDMCKWCIVYVLGFSFIHCLGGDSSLIADFDEDNYNVYETDDAVVIEAPSLRRQVFLQGQPRSIAPNETNFHRTKRQIPWQTLLSGPCITSQGKLGKCTSFRVCYPYFKLPNLNNWESWVLGIYDTCSYFTENGEQAFGVCCTNPNAGLPKPPQATTEVIAPTTPSTTSTATTSKPVDHSTLNPIPPNWPPPIPTHPPNHTIPPLPTHPPSPGYPTTLPTRPSPPTSPVFPPSQKPTTPRPTRPTFTTQRPTRPTFTTQRPTRPTFTTQRPTRPTFTTQRPTRPTFTTQRPTRPTFTTPWPTHPTFTTQRPTIPTAPPLPTRPTTKWPPTHPPLKPTNPPAPPENEIFDGSCGVKNGYQDQERIVGGQTADVNEWPWVAVLFNGGRQFCGGSLIDHEHILSAAHCVAHMTSWDVARVTVRLGDHNIRINTETKHVEKRLKRIVRHRGFDPRTLYNDVAVLTLDSPVTFSRTIRPICLPSGSQNYAGLPATVIGWGSLRESGTQPAELQEVSIPIWTNQDCRLKYGIAAPGGIVEHFLCAGQPSRDSCSGDSGGPLMVSQGKRWTQVGIVSWGIGCGKGQYPGVYTRVTHFMPWIIKNLK